MLLFYRHSDSEQENFFENPFSISNPHRETGESFDAHMDYSKCSGDLVVNYRENMSEYTISAISKALTPSK